MPLKAPAWWQEAPGPWATLLQPLATLYGSIVVGRWGRTDGHRASIPVVCIGNLTAGGSGKTPVAIAVAELLAGMGESPFFLSRGYGGSVSGPYRVHLDQDTAIYVGDEPLLLARQAPTVVCADRVAGAEAAITDGASIIVMDDGFQNPSLRKDLSIVVVDGEAALGNGRVMPAGPMRAPLAYQLERMDVMLVLGPGSNADSLIESVERLGKPVLPAILKPEGETAWLAERPIIAFAGIGRPQKFFTTLQALGASLAEQHAFPDHHSWTDLDAEMLLGAAHRQRAQLVTTEKDWVRLPDDDSPTGRLKTEARALPVTAQFEDSEALKALLRKAIVSAADQPKF